MYRHTLYVKVTPSGDADLKGKQLNIDALRYVYKNIKTLRQMGVIVKAQGITNSDLKNKKIVTALKSKGITNLPALSTGNQIYLGLSAIVKLYNTNIAEFNKQLNASAPEGDDLEQYFHSQMNAPRKEEDEDDEAMGGNNKMMDSYRDMVSRRDQSDAANRPPSGRRGVQINEEDMNQRGHQTHPQRPDNVAQSDDREIQDTLSRLTQDIDNGTRTRATDDEEGMDSSGADDLMERAFMLNNFGDLS